MLSRLNDEDSSDIFSDSVDTPSDYNPFCNSAEVISFNEDYSSVVPTFFFRTQASSVNPSKYEALKIKHFYNTAGTFLLTKLMIEFILFFVFNIVLMYLSSSDISQRQSYQSLISNNSVIHGFKILSTVITTLLIFRMGCRLSGLKPSSLFQNNHKARTSEIISFFMTGIFISSIYNLIIIVCNEFFPSVPVTQIKFTNNIPQILLIIISTCFVVPVANGIIFRGIVLKNMSRVSQKFGIIISSVLCALSSGQAIAFIPCFLMSVMLCKMSIKYNTIFTSVVINITINICNVIIYAYGDLFYSSDPMIIRMWSAITFMTGGLFAVYLLLKEPLPYMNKAQKQRAFPILMQSASTILVFIFYIFLNATAFFINKGWY